MACECDMRLKSILADHQQQQHQDEGASIMALVESAVVQNNFRESGIGNRDSIRDSSVLIIPDIDSV